MENPFVLASNTYKRDLDLMGHYVKDTATYISLMSGKEYKHCLDYIKKELKPLGRFHLKDPEIDYLERDINTGDRERKQSTLGTYLQEAINDKDIIAPTLTTYLNPKVKESLLVTFIDTNVKIRGIAKKEMFNAKMAGNVLLEAIKKNEQINKKLNNNSISGAHVNSHNPLYNKTSHSTLTSNCRSTSGYGNANNEKFLCGNRHYWNPDIVRNNIISIINNTDLKQLEDTMIQFGIRHPTVDETIACYKYSTDLYWNSKDQHRLLAKLISKLSDIQRSAFVYIGDLYHLMKYNDSVVRTFIDKLSTKITIPHPDPDTVLKNAHEDNINLASQICAAELLNVIPNKEQKTTNIRDLKGNPEFGIYASTLENISNVLQEYFNLIRALWVTPNVPASVAVFPDSIRRAAVTSDTDSTIFTVQDWVVWNQGKIGFDDRCMAVAATMIFLASQTITHVLARMSANFGIVEKRIHQIAMKNEFKFDVFVPTDKAKHYYALISCQEGNIFKEYGKEIKGVHLKSSNAPKYIIKEAEKMMLFIMNSIVEGKKISAKYMLKWVADIEREVVDSIKKGNYDLFKVGQIKAASAYTDKEKSAPYQHYLMWQEVFGPKYGLINTLPYTAIKVGVNIDTPAKTAAWIATIEDQDIVNRLNTWLENKGSRSFGSILQLPDQCISVNGIPVEILNTIDTRNIVKDTTSIFYTILETLGLVMLNDRATKLCMDFY